MHRFAALFDALDATTSTDAKVDALAAYFAHAPAADAAWALYFLAGGKPRQVVPTALLREVAEALAGLPPWLFEECYQAVGDLAETIAHVLPPPTEVQQRGLAEWMTQHLLPARELPREAQAERLADWLRGLDTPGRFLLVKLIGGGFRVGVSRQLVQRALARHAGLPPTLLAQRLMGATRAATRPDAAWLAGLLAPPGQGPVDAGQPYPFFLAQPLAGPPEGLGPRGLWQAEWKYDGIRAQLVRRAGRAWLWSRGEELLGEAFPEVLERAAALPDGTVLDGELLVWPEGAARPAPFAQLQQRANRKTVGRTLRERAPVRFVAYDLLEAGGLDQRERPLAQRRAALETLLAAGAFATAPRVDAPDWDGLAAMRATSLDQGVEGLMLKALASAYGVGRTGVPGGGWWKWKLEPERVDGVLIYAQAGHGRRAGVYTDYTFAVWNRAPADAAEAQSVVQAIARREPAQPGALQLVPFTKAYSGLTDAEFAAVDREIRAHTLERFGPVRSVKPTLVVELGFEGIARSKRHKSGVALRFPRMLRLRPDKPLHQADTLASLQALLSAREPET